MNARTVLFLTLVATSCAGEDGSTQPALTMGDAAGAASSDAAGTDTSGASDQTLDEASSGAFGSDAASDSSPATCTADSTCQEAEYCAFSVTACSDVSSRRSIQAEPGRCTPVPCGSRECAGRSCASAMDCGPRETCGGIGAPGKCSNAGLCTAVVTCPTDCQPVLSPYRYCPVCVCPRC
jgi:hypothetical protein